MTGTSAFKHDFAEVGEVMQHYVTIGSGPPGYPYGVECSGAQIQAGTCGERDSSEHGTHVAGTIAALMNAANVRGAAPQANLYIYKILDAGGGGWSSDIVSALQECVRETAEA